MFDNIVIYRNDTSARPISAGSLAEAMLFYGRVHLLLSGGTLSSLLTQLGTEGMIQLMAKPEVHLSYLKQNFGTMGNTVGGLRSLSFGIFEYAGSAGKVRHGNKDDIERIVQRALGRSAASRQLTKALSARMSFPRVEDDLKPDQLTQGARDDLDDDDFVYEAIQVAIATLVPTYRLPSGWHFRVFKLSDGSFAIDTNLDMSAINFEFHKTTSPEHSSITADYLINFIFDSYVGTYLASRYSAEFVHDPTCSSIMKLKYIHLLRRRDRSLNEIDLFQDLHLGGRNIADAIDTGERSFAEFLKLLDEASRFKAWLVDTNPDRKLITEYFEATTRETWIDRLPTKGMRWLITTGLAAAVEALYPTGAAIAAAQGLSFVDATVLDRVLKGWKPNQFVNGPLSEFIGIDGK
jgi:hypothetical protein